MSASLVRRSLDMFKDDLVNSDDTKIKKKKKKASNPMKLISTNRKGVQKELKKIQHTNKRNKLTIKDKKVKSAIDEYQKNLSQDMTSDSLYYLQKFKKAKLHSDVLHKITEYNNGRPRHNKDLEKKEESTLFSDRDFDKFEEEYNFS